MIETIDYGVVGNIKVSVLKDENNGEIDVVITSQTIEEAIPLLNIEQVKLLSSKLLKIADSAQPETCEGCKHLGKYENEVEYGCSSPCTRCKRRVEDNYEGD